jgi:hypothetical protein
VKPVGDGGRIQFVWHVKHLSDRIHFFDFCDTGVGQAMLARARGNQLLVPMIWILLFLLWARRTAIRASHKTAPRDELGRAVIAINDTFD